jgi:AAA domain
MSAGLDLLLQALAAAGCQLERKGGDVWRGHCPACSKDDRLVVGESDLGGRVWIKCHTAECPPHHVLEAVGLTWKDINPPAEEGGNGRRVVFTPATEIVAIKPRWLETRRFPWPGLIVVAGEKGQGKSLYANAELAAKITRGELEGELLGRPATVVIASLEDNWASQIKPRLIASGADMARIQRLTMADGGPPALPHDVETIRAGIEEMQLEQLVGLLVFDPWGAFLAGDVDSHRDAGVRRAIAPLALMCEEREITGLIVAHLNKAQHGSLMSRINGSIGLINAARSVFGFVPHPDDPDGVRGRRKVMLHLACNSGPCAPALELLIGSETVPLEDGQTDDIGRIQVIGECSITETDVGGKDERGDPAAVEEAIIEALIGGEQPSRIVKRKVREELGVSDSTVKRAAGRLEDRGQLVIDRRGFPPVTYLASRRAGRSRRPCRFRPAQRHRVRAP